MFPEKSLAGKEWRLRNGRRVLNKAATSMGCDVFIFKPRNATSATEKLLDLGDQQRNWEKTLGQ